MQTILSIDPVKFIFGLSAALCAVVLGAAYGIGGNLLVTALIAGGFLAVGFALRFVNSTAQDIGAATALIGQAIALTTAFEGHGWQLDTHMLFFALLACLIVLRSIPAILMATAITAVHHLSLSVFMPALVYPAGSLIENLGRTVMHAVIVLIETGVLVATVAILNRLTARARKRAADMEQVVAEANAAREDAEAARHTAEQTRNEAEAAQMRAEDLLKEAQAAEVMRRDAEEEREKARAQAAADAERVAQEQAIVVGLIRDAMNDLKDGDLTTRINRELPGTYRDIGTAFNDAVTQLDMAVGQVTAQSREMQSEIQEIAGATSDLASRTEQQAHTLRESSDRLEQLTGLVSNTETTVKEANTSAQTAQHNARSSEAVVSETSDAMRAIQTEAEEISQIVQVIDEIAFQTNLLALNAGVEAARAGEAGRGFAVVASEVRGLALRSSDSATNIRALIERSAEQVHVGSAKIEETVAALSAVLESVLEFSTKTGTIADGAREQTSGISELNQRVSNLDATTQQNAAMFEETSAACSSLQNSAVVLENLTGKFKVSESEATQTAAA